jgi:hypothetical protein
MIFKHILTGDRLNGRLTVLHYFADYWRRSNGEGLDVVYDVCGDSSPMTLVSFLPPA